MLSDTMRVSVMLPMTQNESNGEEKLTAQKCSLRNKWQAVIWRKKTALVNTAKS